MNTQRRKKINCYLSLLIVAFIVCFVGFYKTTRFSSAESVQASATTFLPETSLENFELISPIDVYYDQTVTAIADDTQKLFINYNGVWQNALTDFTAIKQVKKLNETNLLVSNSGNIYNIDLSLLESSPQTAKTPLTDGINPIGGNFFDINDNYLVTTYSTVCLVYVKTQTGFTQSYSFPIQQDSPIALNDNNQIFFVDSQGNIVMREGLQTTTLCENVFPSKIIADNNFVYYIDGNEIFRLSTAGGLPITLNKRDVDSTYDLGVISSPVALSFKGENLLITEQDTIQEFEIKNNTLIFTGFAIANGKTAYNRIGKNATLVEKTNSSVAVLDNFKFTLFTNTNKQNKYARENYKNYLAEQLKVDQIAPSSFALGNQNALFLYNSNSASSFVVVLDFSKATQFLSLPYTISQNPVIHDICYQSGYYYLLCDNGSAPQHIYRAKADAESLDFEMIDANVALSEFTRFTVDTYSNVYLANNSAICKLSADDGYTNLTEVINSLSAIRKLQTDLLGRLYVLDNNTIKCIENNAVTDFSFTDVKSFGFDFVDNNAFLLFNNSEFISLTTDLKNVAIEDLAVPDDFNISFNPLDPTTANDNLEFFKAKNGANAYIVKTDSTLFTAGETFKFGKLSTYTDEYVLICTIMYNGEQRFYALANQNSITIIDISQVESSNKQVTNLNKTAFVSTDVNCYYLPIITANGEFALYHNSVVRLDKTTEISVKKQLEFLGCDYYYAEFILDGTTYNGYIPCDFTVDVLTEDFEWEQFSLEQVDKTSVYKQADMQEKVFELKKGDTVRILEKGDNVCKIAYQNGEDWEIGYIYTNKIIDEPSIALRNILIVLAVVACVCGTCTFFLLRNKKRAN